MSAAPAYFASDVHLRLDRPERGRRFARWVDGLDPAAGLTIVGDLCDFWFAARQRPGRGEPLACEGLRALAGRRDRGGSTTILLGNHDAWLGPFYRRALGVEVVDEPRDVTSHGQRLRLVHGHRLGARSRWKAVMEGRAFYEAYRHTPGPVAGALAKLLERDNARRMEATDARHRVQYRAYADALAGVIDILVVGHIHVAWDDQGRAPRLVVPGGWQRRSSYLRVDDRGAALVVVEDDGATAESLPIAATP